MTNGINLLLNRRSVSANKLGEPGPGAAELRQILTAGARVPDHKKLAPWRFVLFQGDARAAFGEVLARACAQEQAEVTEFRLETERKRFLRAPVVIAAVCRVRENPAVPEWEQILSVGAACQNILNAAQAIGYAAQWITEWYSYSAHVREALALAANERLAGFIYIGTAREPPQERERPSLDQIVSSWRS